MYISGIDRRGAFPGTRGELAGADQQQVSPVSHATTYIPNGPTQNQGHHHFFTWIYKIISIVLSIGAAPFSSPISHLPASSGSLDKRSADTSPNTLTSVVAGVLVTVFVILAGGFLYVYRRSIHFRKQARRRRRHRHRRRASGTSKISQGSDAAGGGAGGDGGADGGAVAPDASAQA